MKSEQRYFDNIDPNLPEAELSQELYSRRGAMICDCTTSYDVGEDVGDCLELSHADEAIIREYLSHSSEQVRAMAVYLLIDLAEPSWGELEQWVQDPSEQVRETALNQLDFLHCGNEDWTTEDSIRLVSLVERAIERYPGHATVTCLWEMATANEEDYWFDLTWEAAERLVDLGNETAIDYLTTCYFWSIIPDLPLLANDPRIKRWVESNEARRREILDYVVTMAGTRVEELSRTAILLFEQHGNNEYKELANKLRGIRRKSYLPEV